MNAITAAVPRAQDNIIRMRDVQRRTGLHRATIYRKIHAGTFPAGVKIGENSTGWYESEVNRWVESPR